MDAITKQLNVTTFYNDSTGVSFKGKGLKFDTKKDVAVVSDAIRSCKSLTYLDLEGNTLGVDAAEGIAEALKTRGELKRALWKDLFTGRMKTEIPKALTFLGNALRTAGAKLKLLDLSDNAFGPIGVEALVTLLTTEVCYELEELRLNNNGLGITGGTLLANALLNCYTNSLAANERFALKVFIAGRNRLEDKGATMLSKVFETLGSLEEIVMPQNGIQYRGITMISNSLQNNFNLRILNLNDNTLTPKGAMALASVIPQLQKLQILNLGDCLLKNRGAMVLAGALVEGHLDLEEVYFDSNEIRSDGALAVIRSLKNKPKLKKINVSDNLFGKNTKMSIISELEAINKAHVLEWPSDDEEEEEDTEENSDDGSEIDEEEEDDETDNDDDSDSVDEGHEVDKDMDEFTKVISGLILKEDTPIGRFMDAPTLGNFMKVGDSDISAMVKSSETEPTSVDVEGMVELIMKISHLASNKDEQVAKRSRNMAMTLYRALFKWAGEEKISKVNNTLFVYLNLIKDEDNRLKVTWDVDQCIKLLQSAITQQFVPTFTQHILTCCLNRKLQNGSH